MSDTVFLRGLEIDTVIGVYDWERELRQRLIIDVEMAWDIKPAASSDKVQDALDYSAVARRLREFAAAQEFLLIERMAEAMAALLISEFAVPWLRLRLCKPGAVPEADDVGVLIERGNRPS
ncbi:MAG: dihydroneopterin aldolase [Pseudomonadota bacterium]